MRENERANRAGSERTCRCLIVRLRGPRPGPRPFPLAELNTARGEARAQALRTSPRTREGGHPPAEGREECWVQSCARRHRAID